MKSPATTMLSILVFSLLCVAASSSSADLVTPRIIFGSGNANGGFTIDRNDSIGLELGLRAKQRFPAANVFNKSGNVYTFSNDAAPSGGASWVTSETPIWNFEFSINSNTNGNGGFLDSLIYVLQIDFDPSAAISGPSFDPIRPATHLFDGLMVDNSYGDNSTTYLTDTKGDAATTSALAGSNNVAQNSQNYEFWNNVQSFDPTALGDYTLTLTAIDTGFNVVGSTSIIVAAVPEPTAALFGSLLAAGLGVTVARRRRTQTDAV